MFTAHKIVSFNGNGNYLPLIKIFTFDLVYILQIYMYFLQRNLLWSNSKIFFARGSEHLGITPLTGKFVKTSKKSALFDYIVLDGHKASFNNFLILLKETNTFKQQFKKSLLISRDKPILNKNIYPFPLELFD